MNHPSLASTSQPTRRMFIRDLVLNAQIGVYAHEHGKAQRVRLNLDLRVSDPQAANMSRGSVGADDLARVVDYDIVINAVRQIISTGHVQLVETLAERVAEACLQDPRVRSAKVIVEKLDVFADASSVGVEIERFNTNFSTSINNAK